MACLSVGRVSWLICTGLSFNTRSKIRAMKPFASGCVSWRISDAGSAIGGLVSCLAREGFEVNHKKLFRLYREEGLAVRRRRSRKRALGTRRPIWVPNRANQRWSLDFVSDAFEDGQRFRVLCIVDDCTREALATVVDRSLPGARMTRELDELIRKRGRPGMFVSDNVLCAE